MIFEVFSIHYIFQLYSCNNEDKNYLIKIGMVEDLKKIVDGFMYNADLIAEAFCVIACLSDMGKTWSIIDYMQDAIPSSPFFYPFLSPFLAPSSYKCTSSERFQAAVIDCSLHKPVLEAVERHSTHEILVESALEILIILTQNSQFLFINTLYITMHNPLL